MFELTQIYFLSIKRSSVFDAQLFIKILSLLGFGYLFANLIFIGFFLNRILESFKPDILPFDTFCRIFLFIWVVDIIIKFFYKSNKNIDILPYLTLPIKLNKIFSLMFVKELLSKWNIIWVVMLTPFFFKTVYPANGLSSTLLLIFVLYFISITISFLLRFINVTTVYKSFFYYPVPLILAICVAYIAFNVSVVSNPVIDINLLVTNYKIEVFIIMLLLFSCLYVTFLKCSKREIYIQLTGKNKSISVIKLNWLDNLGINGEVFKLCLKEITRSQLKRNIFILILFLFLLIFTKDEVQFNRLLFSIIPMLMIGSALGEFSFIAESMLFDKLMTLPINIPYLILKVKYLVCLFIFGIFTILLIVFTFNKISILFWTSIFFFGGGPMSFFFFQSAVYNKHRMDMLGSLRKVSSINLHSLISIGCILSILGIVRIIAWLSSETTALYFMLILGIAFTFTSPFWLRNIYNRFLKRKYQNMNGFRNI